MSRLRGSFPAGRVAAAPISWGVCEVPGWGYQLPVDRVLAEMAGLGVAATEFGPDGFLPAAPAAAAAALATHRLRAVGGFVPVVAHRADVDPLPAVDRVLDGFVAAGAGSLVLAAVSGAAGYDARAELTGEQWRTLLANLDRLAAQAAGRGVRASLHPHVGTLVETPEQVERVLAGAAIPLTLDTGHLLIGGSDPGRLAADATDRIAHVHLKDVDAATAARVRSGELGYAAAVGAGLYRPLGAGDVDVAGIVTTLECGGYTGWYVLEQDTVLAGPPPDGAGPAADVAASLAYLRGLWP